MPIHDDLGLRMKHNYEQPAQTRLIRRMPVAIRIDGKSFHTFTKGFWKPFDHVLIKSMQETMKYLCENIQGCVFGYTQSDEITLILIDYKKLTSEAWFDYEVQKMCSIAASMATMSFNKNFMFNVNEYLVSSPITNNYSWDSHKAYQRALQGAMFDARCFNIPREEVANLIYWRQLDAVRNSVQMVAQSQFSQKELQGLNCTQLKQKLIKEKHIDWSNYLTVEKRGTACYKEKGKWIIDKEMPILRNTKECNYRYYVEKWLEEEES